MNYLWDTNISIYYLQLQMPPDVEAFLDNNFTEDVPAVSAITEIELLSWKSGTDNDWHAIKRFLNNIKIIELEHPVKMKTAEIRRQNKIKLPDAIIAATALHHNLTLITRNTKDFDKIENLLMINPFLLM